MGTSYCLLKDKEFELSMTEISSRYCFDMDSHCDEVGSDFVNADDAWDVAVKILQSISYGGFAYEKLEKKKKELIDIIKDM